MCQTMSLLRSLGFLSLWIYKDVAPLGLGYKLPGCFQRRWGRGEGGRNLVEFIAATISMKSLSENSPPRNRSAEHCSAGGRVLTTEQCSALHPGSDSSKLSDLPIPDRLNVALVLGVFALTPGLLWLGSHVQSWWAVFGVGVVFSYLLLTNYALLHEASHGNLQSDPRRNYLLGLMAGLIFPMPFTLMRSTHQGHHDHNRTDVEMFDLYYPHDNRVIQFVRWYGILFGFFWPLAPLGAVLFSISPRAVRTRLFERFKPTGYLIGGVPGTGVWV